MEFIQNFKNYLLSKEVSLSEITVKNYLADIKQFLLWCENKFPDQFSLKNITPELLQEFKKENLSNLSASSADRHMSSLRKFFNFLKLEGIISHSPLDNQDKIKVPSDPYKLKEFKDFLYVYNVSHLTIKNYLIDIKQFIEWLDITYKSQDAWDSNEKNLVAHIRNETLETYKNRLMNENIFSPASINRKLSSLRKYINWAKSVGIINDHVDIPQGTYTSSKPLIPFEQDKNEEKIKIYSRFPPVRVVEKILQLINFIFEYVCIIPLAGITQKVRYQHWKMKGSPLFIATQLKNNNDISEVKNISKNLYAPLQISSEHFPWYKKLVYHIQYTRPDWYQKYRKNAISTYFNTAIMIIFVAALSTGIYVSFFQKPHQQNPAFAALPVAPPRILSFQGRLSDVSDNPISASTNLRFAIYNSINATGSALLWQEVDNVTPDSDGVFSTLLGNNTSIPSTLFSQNSSLYLGVTVEATPELTPRQQLATVAYAANAETLQGLPPITQSGAGTQNVVLALDSGGNLTIGASTTFQSSGQFTLSGNALVLNTNAGSNGNITLAPDGSGIIDLQKPLQNTTNNNNIPSAAGAVEIDDIAAILATSSGQSALTINQNGGGPIISASSGGSAKFTVDNSGNVTANTFYTGLGTSYYISSTLSSLNTLSLNSAGGVASSLIPILTDTYDLGSNPNTGGNEWNNLYVKNIYSNGQIITATWQRALGLLSPTNISDDMGIGGTSTASAKFQVYGSSYVNDAGTVPAGTATTSGNISFRGNPGSQTVFQENLLNGSNLSFNNSIGGDKGINTSTPALYIGANGRIGLGTTSPTSALTVAGNITPDNNNTRNIGSTSKLWSDIFSTYGDINQGLAVGNITGNNGLSSGVNFGTGTTSIATISGNTSFAGLVVDNAGNGDIFTASSSGASKFVISHSGNVGIGTTNPASFILETSGSIGPHLNNTYDLGSSLLNWRNLYAENVILPSSGGIGGYWQLNNGALSPTNISNDLLIGGTGTTSATFQVFASTGNATTTGTLTFNGGDTIQTTNNQTLTLGGLTTGNITLSPLNGNGIVNINGNTVLGQSNSNTVTFNANVNSSIYPSITNTDNLGSTSLQWNNIYAANFYQNGQLLIALWQRNLGVLSPLNITDDLAIGGTSTGSATYHVFSNTGTSSQSGNEYFSGTSPLIATTNQRTLTLGDTNTGSIALNPNGSTGLFVNNQGYVGIGTTTPSDVLTVSGGNITIKRGSGGYFYNDDNSSVIKALFNGQGDWLGLQANSSNVFSFADKTGNSNALSTGNILSLKLNGDGSGGSVGIGTTNPLSNTGLDIEKNSLGNAALVVNQLGNGDILTASASGGTTELRLTGAGQLQARSFYDLDNLSYFLDPAATNLALNIEGTASTAGNLTFADTSGTNPQVNILNGNRLDFKTSRGGDTGLTTALSILNNGTIGIGTTQTLGTLDLRGNSGITPIASISGSTSFAGLIVDNANNGDLFTASSSGLTRFVINKGGIITDSGYSTGVAHFNANGLLSSSPVNLAGGVTEISNFLPTANGGLNANVTPAGAGEILYSNSSTTYSHLAHGTSGQCLTSTGASAPTWGNCGTGSGGGYWTLANGALFPVNSTLDLLVGGNSTGSAKFSVTNISSSNTPVASISAQNAGNQALVLDSAGNIQTTSDNPLTIGGNSTGNITLRPLGGTNGVITFAGYGIGVVKSTPFGVLSSSALDLSNANYVTNSLSVTNGGTGLNALASGNLLYGSGSTVMNSLSVGTTNQILTSSGTSPQWSSSLTLTGLTVNGDTTLGSSSANLLNVNALLNTNLIPNGNGIINLGSSTNFYNNVYANNIIAPVSGGTSGFWTLSNNVLYPVNTSFDLAVGGTGTGSATPFQVFASTVGYNIAGSATTSGDITFRGSNSTSPQINILNGQSMTLQSSPGGDSGLGTILVINNNGNITQTGNFTTSGNMTINGGNLSSTQSTFNLLNSTTTTINFAGQETSLVIGNSSGNNQLLGNLSLGTAGRDITFVGNVNSNILPASDLTYDLGAQSTNRWRNIYAGNLLLPITGGTGGYWQLTSNGVLAPTNTSNDFAIGGSATSSATPFQIFANNYTNNLGLVPAGTATTSGNLTFRGATTSATTFAINLLNNSSLGFYESLGGDKGITTSSPALFLSNNGNIGIGTATPKNSLDVNGSAVIGTFAGNTQNTQSNSLSVSGFIGLGTTSPLGKLDIEYTDTSPNGTAALKIGNTSSGGDNWYVRAGATGTNTIPGGLSLANDSNYYFNVSPYGNIGIGANTNSLTNIGNAELVVNQTNTLGLGDIFSASTSGTPKFTIANDGSIKNSLIPNLIGANGIDTLYNLGAATAEWDTLYVRQIITPTNGGIAGYWQLSNTGVLSPANQTNDVAIGGTATGSATPFQIFANSYPNDLGTVPAGTATTAGNLTFRGVSGSQTPFSLNLLNGSSLGFYTSAGGDKGVNASNPSLFIAASGNIGIGTTNPASFILQAAGNVGPNATNSYNLGSPTLEWNNIYANNFVTPLGKNGQNGLWQLNNGAISPANITNDLLIGGNATGSATPFQIYGSSYVNDAGIIPAGTASTSGQLSFTSSSQVNLLNNSTWSVLNSVGGDLGLGANPAIFVSANGRIGLGTTSPTSALTVAGNITPDNNNTRNIGSTSKLWSDIFSTYGDINQGLAVGNITGNNGLSSGVNFGTGTTSIATISGNTSFAGLVVDNAGNGDLITASTSGKTQFSVLNSGQLQARAFYDLDNLNYYLDPAATSTSLNIAGTASLSGNLVFNGGGSQKVDLFNNSSLGFYPSVGGVESANPSLFIANSGNLGYVGIGTTTPLEILSVAGNGEFGAGDNGTPLAATIRGAAANGTNIAGANLTFDASNGTGTGGSGDLIFRTASTNLLSVTNDANSSTTATNTTSVTWSHTVGTQSNRLLVVGIGNNLGETVSSATFDGSSLTKLAGQSCTNVCHEEFWYLINPASGTHNIVVNFSASTTSVAAGASSYYNVAQTGTFGTFSKASGISTTASVTVTTSSTQLVVDTAVTRSGTSLTAGGSQTQEWNVTQTGNRVSAGSSLPATGTSTGMSWTLGSSIDWGEIAVGINPASSGSSTTADTLTDRFHITASGNVGIGTTSPSSLFSVANQLTVDSSGNEYSNGAIGVNDITTSGSQAFLRYESDVPGIRVGGTGAGATSGFNIEGPSDAIMGTWNNLGDYQAGGCVKTNQRSGTVVTIGSCLSDERLKTNIQSLPANVLGNLLQLNPVTFNWKTNLPVSDPQDFNPNLINYGLIAQQVQPLFPNLVTLGADGYYRVTYGLLDFYLIQGLKEQQQEIATLSAALSIDNTGNVTFDDTTASNDFTIPHYFTLNNALGNPITRVEELSQAAIANLRAGVISTQQLFTNSLVLATDNVTIAGQSLKDYIISVVTNAHLSNPFPGTQTARVNIISPLATSSAITIDLSNSKIEIKKNANSIPVAGIDNNGNATFSGSLNAENLAINNDATIAGTLHVHKIVADSIELTTENVSTIAAQNTVNITNIYYATPSGFPTNQNITTGFNASSSSTSGSLSSGSNYVNIASLSGEFAYVPNLKAATGFFTDGLAAIGPTSLVDTTINGQLTINSSLILANNSINVMGSDLQIQPFKQGGVNFADGAIRIDRDGNLTVNGNSIFNGVLAANIISPLSNNKDLTFQLGSNNSTNSALATSNLSVKNASGSSIFNLDQLGNIVASGEATIEKLNFSFVQPAQALSNTEVVATGSAGTAAIAPYQTEVTIDNTKITANSLVYITPVGNASGEIPYLRRQVSGQSLTVGIAQFSSIPTYFNWLIVN